MLDSLLDQVICLLRRQAASLAGGQWTVNISVCTSGLQELEQCLICQSNPLFDLNWCNSAAQQTKDCAVEVRKNSRRCLTAAAMS